jgi:hypothetical protein
MSTAAQIIPLLKDVAYTILYLSIPRMMIEDVHMTSEEASVEGSTGI